MTHPDRRKLHEDVAAFVQKERRNRVAHWDTIAKRVRERWPDDMPDFDAAAARKIFVNSAPKDFRTREEKEAVPISLGGPEWSRPKRRAG